MMCGDKLEYYMERTKILKALINIMKISSMKCTK